MSRENVEVVRQVFDGVVRRDAASVLALYDPNVEWDASRVGVGQVMGPGVYHGHEGVRSWFREWYAAWENVEDACDELIDAGEHVISVVTGRARGRTSGLEVEYRRAGVWTIRAGKIVRVVWFSSREEALEAVGLSE